MNQILQTLLDQLDLEKLEEDLYRGKSNDLGGKSMFGGQVVGQCLAAAFRTVDPERRAHSLQGYYLRPGDMSMPVVFQVERIRDGKSFATRRILALQKGKPIFAMSASFQSDEEGFDHQCEMPEVPPPEGRPTIVDLRREMLEMDPQTYTSRPVVELPIELRPVRPINPYLKDKMPPIQQIWFRASERLPDDPVLHQCILAYASDFGLFRTASLPHDFSLRQRGAETASIDHTLWLHREVRVDDWLLYDMFSPSATNGRGFAHGRIFTRDGVLAASAAQEGLIRAGR